MKTTSFALALFAATIVWTTSAAAGPLAPKKPSELVTLFNLANPCPTIGYTVDNQILSDGTTAPFTIPPGMVLVLTGAEWNETGGPPSASDTFNLSLDAAGTVYVARSTATLDAAGTGGGSVEISGVAVKSGVPLCASLFPSANVPFGIVHGYLKKDK